MSLDGKDTNMLQSTSASIVPVRHTEERVLWDSGTRRAASTAGHTLRLDSRIGVAVAPGAQQCETARPNFA